jgi:hypothetical protein
MGRCEVSIGKRNVGGKDVTIKKGIGWERVFKADYS